MSCQGEYENISKLALRKFKFVKDTVSHQLVVMAVCLFLSMLNGCRACKMVNQA